MARHIDAVVENGIPKQDDVAHPVQVEELIEFRGWISGGEIPQRIDQRSTSLAVL
jgi:hypothetical protein